MTVYYKRLIEGVTIPAVIHNSGYYYQNMPVYEDGSVDCWHRVGCDDLPRELERGWLVTEIPVGKAISIHGLGAYEIKEAVWDHTPESYLDHIRGVIRTMNPGMEGLFRETPQQKEKWSTHKVSWSARGKPYKLGHKFGYTLLDGETTSLLCRVGDGWQLTALTAYGDGTLALDGAEGELTAEDVWARFESGALTSCIEGEFQLVIPGFGRLRVVGQYQVAPGEKQKEIADCLAELRGDKTSHELCRQAYVDYLIYPDGRNRERLREAYEKVPEHERMYLGDMDSKDSDYRRILYHPDKKREV